MESSPPADPLRLKKKIRLMDQGAKCKIRDTFAELEQKLEIDGLGTVLTTAILELVENAVKANLKRAFFKKNGYRLEDRESYAAGVKAFVQSYGALKDSGYGQALQELELKVIVEVDNNRDRLLISVENNTMMLASEEARIRRQLAAAMTSVKFIDFTVNYGDETEGSGLGLAMIVFLIRNIGFDPENFRVFREDGKTVARLEFPLHADYVPIRDRWKEEASC